nr:hypothetical protein [Tanacetum cinerariifolium]
MHKASPLLVRKFPLPEGTSLCLKKNATARRKVTPLPKDCTAVIIKKKLLVKDDSFLKISAPCLALYSSSNRKCNIMYKDSLYYKRSPLVRDNHKFQASHCIHSFKIPCNPSASKVHSDSYEAPENNPSTTTTSTMTTSTTSGDKSRRTVTLTTEDMQKKKNDDINQINEDDMEEMDIKWNMALLSMRVDKF